MKLQTILKNYIKDIYQLDQRGDAREESYYSALAEMIKNYAQSIDIKNVDISILSENILNATSKWQSVSNTQSALSLYLMNYLIRIKETIERG